MESQYVLLMAGSFYLVIKQVGIQVLRRICLIDNLADVINKITQG